MGVEIGYTHTHTLSPYFSAVVLNGKRFCTPEGTMGKECLETFLVGTTKLAVSAVNIGEAQSRHAAAHLHRTAPHRAVIQRPRVLAVSRTMIRPEEDVALLIWDLSLI